MTSAQRKFDRGIEQLAELVGELHRYTSIDGGYTFDFEIGDCVDKQTPVKIYATEQEPPDPNWSLRAGEAIQNVRSSLDYAVWAAWSAVGDNTGDGRHTMFPITTNATAFKNAHGRLKGLPTSLVDVIEEQQPYVRAPMAPGHDGLAVLAELSNTDKHRTLATITGVVGTAAIGHNSAPESIERWTHGMFEELRPGRNEVASFVFRSETPPTKHDVNPMYTFEVRIEGIPLRYLRSVVHRAYEALHAVEHGTSVKAWDTFPMILHDGTLVPR